MEAQLYEEAPGQSTAPFPHPILSERHKEQKINMTHLHTTYANKG